MRTSTFRCVWVAALAAVMPVVLPPLAAAQEVPYEDVVRRLSDPKARERVVALQQLRQSNRREAVVPVAALVNDPDQRVQLEAIETELSFFLVENMEPRTSDPAVVESRTGSAGRAFAAGPMAVQPIPVPPEIIRALIVAMDSPSKLASLDATYALGVLTRPPSAAGDQATFRSVVEALASRLGYEDAAHRRSASDVLSRLFWICGPACTPKGDDRVGNLLITRGLNDADAGARIAATAALGALRYTYAVQALSEQFIYFRTGPSGIATLDALARIASRSSAALFKPALSDGNPAIRRAAVEGLARTGELAGFLSAALPALESDKAPEVRLAVAFARQCLGRAQQLDVIVTALENPKTREQARNYLIELGSPTVGALTGFLQGRSRDVRVEVAGVLGLIGDQSAVPALEPLVNDSEPKVAAAADMAIGWIRLRAHAPARRP
jgi:hypothetical protein